MWRMRKNCRDTVEISWKPRFIVYYRFFSLRRSAGTNAGGADSEGEIETILAIVVRRVYVDPGGM